MVFANLCCFFCLFYEKAKIKCIAHITGGGIPGNFSRILPKNSGLGIHLPNLFSPPPIMSHIQNLGNITDREAYRTWNMGNGMLLVVPSAGDSVGVTLKLLRASGIDAQVAGVILPGENIRIVSKGAESAGSILEFPT